MQQAEDEHALSVAGDAAATSQDLQHQHEANRVDLATTKAKAAVDVNVKKQEGAAKVQATKQQAKAASAKPAAKSKTGRQVTSAGHSDRAPATCLRGPAPMSGRAVDCIRQAARQDVATRGARTTPMLPRMAELCVDCWEGELPQAVLLRRW